ncbi:MAG: excinuclease ABC subunit UvrA [Proteobacteria bacterium]|nr:excinuclease ABC subunit UvrA [Pseudomonadota bacterium]MBU1687553.1 excinuclease ABC subunit UvrA [Pseudomonadota bacterium]
MEPNLIKIRGARMHNLKNIDIDLPRNRLIVFCGLSGSGKSTLAFDTLYAEGQRRYVESLSTYARQFLGQMEKPDVDSLEGLSPAVSIEQRTTSRNPRSTVGTITEIYDYLRLLFARVGHPYCPDCGQEISPQSIQDMVDSLLQEPVGTKLMILAPVVDGRKGEHRELFGRLKKDGYVRVRVNGQFYNLEEDIVLDRNLRHHIEVVVDRWVMKEGSERRLTDSIGTAVALSNGVLLVNFPDRDIDTLFSERAACISCGRSMPELSPRLFSFNNPHGACFECKGLGVKQFFDPDLVVPDSTLSIRQGALVPWGDPWRLSGGSGRFKRFNSGEASIYGQQLEALARHYHFDLDQPFKKLSATVQRILLNGSGNEEIEFEYRRNQRHTTTTGVFEGVVPSLARRFIETSSSFIRDELANYMNEQVCPACQGARLRPEALAVKVGAWSIDQLTNLSIVKLRQALLDISLRPQEELIADRVTREINDRLSFLENVGLGYLSLKRTASTLSGGEAQRIRLASQIGSRLAGVLYILDEPSIGLHQRDNQRLIETLINLRELGNTVIVVEHDADTIMAADHILDMGPGAGVHGGEVVYSGDVKGLLASSGSLTGGYLSGRLSIEIPEKRRPLPKKRQWLLIQDAQVNNLKKITVRIPTGLITCVTGVSGSGKSSLVIETLYRYAMKFLQGGTAPEKFGVKLGNFQTIDKIIDIDQSPIGRTPRSNPATYTGVLTPVRELLARLPESRARGYRPGRFSFNIKGGRCEACEGEGVIKIVMHFLPDIYVTCDTCEGRRYNRETLEIRYRGKNIAEILAMNVEEALAFFNRVPVLKARSQTLFDVGLGYVALGQSSLTLSGGEAQRIKLARELTKRSTGKTLYILDEPTTGLHPDDIKNLLAVLQRLADSGNTIVIIEHNLDVIKTADYVIDLGPEGGDEGGEIVACGTPEEVALVPASHTGHFLQKELQKTGI